MIKINKPIHIALTVIALGAIFPMIFWGDQEKFLQADQLNDSSLCEKITNPLIYKNCYERMLYKKGLFCEQVNDPNIKQSCLNEMAIFQVKTKDAGLYLTISIALLISSLLILFFLLKFISIIPNNRELEDNRIQ